MTYNLTGENLTGNVALVIEGTDASLFSVDMPTISPAGDEISGTTVTVTFRPTTAGDPFTAMITHSSGGLTPVVVNLTGSAVSPTLTSTESNLDFVNVNTASPGTMTYDLTGENLTGNVALVIEGTDASLFSVDMPTISPAGDEISGTTVTVTFRPTTAGDSFEAMITHSGGGLTTPVVVNLTGSAVSPSLTFAVDGSLPDGITQDPPGTGTTFDFGDVNTGLMRSINFTVTGENLIETNGTMLDITPTGMLSLDTSKPLQVSVTPATIMSGGITLSFVATFNPSTSTTGDSEGTITFGGATSAQPVVLTLKGTGVVPTLEATPNSLNFGDLNISSAPGTITYDLTGANLTEDVTLELGGSDASLFTIISPTGSIAQSSGVVSQQITVTFNPTVVGNSFTAMITHRGGGLTTPLVVSLEGTGTLAPTPTLEATPNSLDFRDVNTASTTTNEMTYSLTGANLTGVVTLERGGTDASLFSVDMATISPAGDEISGTTVTVTFSPTDAGSFTAMITHSGGGLTPVVVNLMGSAVSPTLTSTESNLDFGDLNIDSTPGTITYNLTGANLTEDVTLELGGAAPADIFTISPTGPIAQSSGTVSQMITVTFNPTAAQAYNAMITHSSDGLTAPLVVSLAGTGTLAAPTLEATPNSLNFGDLNIDSTPGRITYDLTGANLTEDVTLKLGGIDASLFTISPTGPIAQSSGTVSQQITVTFNPTAAQRYSAMITHSSGGLTTPLVVSLEGTGTLAATPTLEATPNSLDFRDVNTASTTTNEMTYSLTGANLTGQVNLELGGTDASLFSVDMATISPAGNAISGTTVTVTFRPTTAGDSFAAMITHSGGGLAPVVVNLAGSAVSPTLTSTESNLDFGDVSTASTSGTMTYDLTGANLTGDVTLTIEGTNADLFTISPTGPIAQSSGTVSQMITVTFDPTVAGDSFTAMITHSGGGLTSPLVVSLEGAGVPPPPVLGFATRAISNLRLSPNPVTGLLYVQGHGLGDMTVTVRSIAGKVHGSYTIRNTGKVPFSGLPSGMYIVQIVSQTGIVTKQVIKSSGL